MPMAHHDRETVSHGVIARVGGRRGVRARSGRGGFSLLDLMVSIGVMAVLIALLTPALGTAYESARRVKCMSNLRQIGTALQLYADDWNGALPRSAYSSVATGGGTGIPMLMPQETIFVNIGHELGPGVRSVSTGGWDGLGILADPTGNRYLSHPEVLYCPSHHAEHSFDRYRSDWVSAQGERIAGNYQYRLPIYAGGILERMDPGTTIVSDGIRSQADYNHTVGNNMLKADLSVSWYEDSTRAVYNSLAADGDSYSARSAVMSAWGEMDADPYRPVSQPVDAPNWERNPASGANPVVLRR